MSNGKDASGAAKLLKFEKVIAAGVPFGGIVKYSVAPDDGKPLKRTPGKPVHQENTIKEVQLVYEVVEFGNTKEQKK